ncbi:oxidoreductase [Hyaloraphidium curvatum]|nr:oxidoreductase [Hyaloraphidium curvatum]
MPGTRMVNKSSGKGRVSLVTGAASQGFGRAIAKALAAEGARVAVSDVPARQGEGQGLVDEIAKDGGEAFWVPLDVTDESQWSSAVDVVENQFGGPLDVLVNNAGISSFIFEMQAGGFEELSLESWKKVHEVNVDGVFLGHKYGIKSMKKNTAAEVPSIVNLSSQAGMQGVAVMVAYSSSKWAVRGLTKSVAAYCSSRGYRIRANSVHPGVFATDMARSDGIVGPDGEVRMPIEAMSLLKRTGDVSELANLVLFLASDESSYCNATEFVITGGSP